MENSDNKKTSLEILENTFANINNWLNFAEAKNAALIAFNIAVIAAVLSSEDILNKNIIFYMVNCILILSSILAMISFKPDMGNDRKVMQVNNDSDNLLLFSHIAKYTKEKYLIEMYQKYLNVRKCEEDLTKIELDYADEITYNAKITVNKYKWFKRALYVDFVGICGVAILVISA